MRNLFNYIVVFLCFGISSSLFAQTIPIGTQGLEDYYRRLQLQGKLDSTISFSSRPLSNEALKQTDIFDPLNNLKDNGFYKSLGPISFAHGNGVFQILPFTWQQQINSHHPYGWNDGAMVPAKGYQTMLSGGFFAKFGPLSIQLRPEYVYASNTQFDGYGENRSDEELFYFYNNNYNWIDNPDQFGKVAYKRFNWGQSSIRLTVGPASLGLSNENLWWGPGIKNSLMMSNNAQGFKHLTLNTVRPVKTPVGSFEGQVFGGRLESSGFTPTNRTLFSTGLPAYTEPRNEWRYLAGLNINYQPKWLPGLFIGFTRTFMSYGADLEGLDDYIPFFIPFQKNKIENGIGDDGPARDQRTSFYTRWLFKKAKAEVYFEYGLNDNSYSFREFLASPEHSRAYLFGLKKIVTINAKTDEGIQFNAEITQMSQSTEGILLRNAFSYYYHSGVRQGYTNNGEVIGAGSGTGGNLQSFDISWVRGLKRLGLSFDRLEHNRDFYDSSGFANARGGSRSWVDLALAAEANWDYKNFLFNAKVQGIKSLNYQWRQKDFTNSQYYIPHNTVFNFHGELGVAFRF